MKASLMRELRIRGLILEILKSEPNGPIDFSDLQGRLYLFGYALMDSEIMPHLRYLEDREYLRLEKKLAGTILLVHITSYGDDIVRGLKEDEGVLIPKCGRPHGHEG